MESRYRKFGTEIRVRVPEIRVSGKKSVEFGTEIRVSDIRYRHPCECKVDTQFFSYEAKEDFPSFRHFRHSRPQRISQVL